MARLPRLELKALSFMEIQSFLLQSAPGIWGMGPNSAPTISHWLLNINPLFSSPFHEIHGDSEKHLLLLTRAMAWEKWSLPFLITSENFRGKKNSLRLPRFSKYLVSLKRMGTHFPILKDFSVPSSFLLKTSNPKVKSKWHSNLQVFICILERTQNPNKKGLINRIH